MDFIELSNFAQASLKDISSIYYYFNKTLKESQPFEYYFYNEHLKKTKLLERLEKKEIYQELLNLLDNESLLKKRLNEWDVQREEIEHYIEMKCFCLKKIIIIELIEKIIDSKKILYNHLSIKGVSLNKFKDICNEYLLELQNDYGYYPLRIDFKHKEKIHNIIFDINSNFKTEEKNEQDENYFKMALMNLEEREFHRLISHLIEELNNLYIYGLNNNLNNKEMFSKNFVTRRLYSSINNILNSLRQDYINYFNYS